MAGVLTHRLGLGGRVGGQAIALSDNYYDSIALMMLGDEGAAATSGTDSGPNGYTWTASGDADVTGGYYTFDGTGDHITLSSDAHDWNFLHDGSLWTAEVTVKGRPTNGSNVVFATNGAASSTIGAGMWITSAGNIRVIISRGVNGQSLINYTSSFAVPNDSADHHIVLEWNWGFQSGGFLRVAMDGVRYDEEARAAYQFEIDDASYDLVIGQANVTTTINYNGQFKNLRIWKNRVVYGLSQNSTYDELPYITSDTAAPKLTNDFFFPSEETAAAGRTWDTYLAEPRIIDKGNGTFHCYYMIGPSHAAATGTIVVRSISTNYCRSWGAPTTIASDGTYSVRNHAVGLDSNGVEIVVYRKFDGSTTQGIFYRTSADSFAAETEITSSLTSALVPWYRGVQTDDGLMFTFYDEDFAEVLYWDAGTETFGTRRTIYDETGTSPGYNEPTAISDSAGRVVWIARRDGAGGNDFAFYQSSDAGASVSSLGEVQWTGTTFTAAAPCAMCFVGDNVHTTWSSRGSAYEMHRTTTPASAFWADPKEAMDGTRTITSLDMRTSLGTEYNANYGYPDVIPLTSTVVFQSRYEQATDTQDDTRLWGVAYVAA